jgi:uncharacterized phage protein (TIGR01671 family)
MKRNIKFRFWNTVINTMSKWEQVKIEFRFGALETDPYIPMLFTGLHDKSGNEIYEGDILEHDNGVKYSVIWMEQLGGFYLQQPNTQRGKEIISCAASKVANEPMLLFKEAVIGNIYENPELLDTKKAQLSEPKVE